MPAPGGGAKVRVGGVQNTPPLVGVILPTPPAGAPMAVADTDPAMIPAAPSAPMEPDAALSAPVARAEPVGPVPSSFKPIVVFAPDTETMAPVQAIS